MVVSVSHGFVQLIFEEVDRSSVPDPGADHWYFRITSDQLAIQPGLRTITDPFKVQQHEQCAKYLIHQASDASGFGADLDRYRRDLFNSLQLGHCTSLLVKRHVEILIRAVPRGNPHKSFHAIQWEQLEVRASWLHHYDVDVSSVLVRRVVVPPTIAKLIPRHTYHTCNILLVIARKYVFERRLDVPRPNIIKGVILKLQEELHQKTSAYSVCLEIVRPGCFAELQQHLADRAALSPNEPYDIVHFDMHGHVSKSKGSQLIFNKYDGNGHLQTEKVAASCVAAELSTRHVRCAIFNGCKTAYAGRSDHDTSNLGETFIRHHHSNVLAMSFDVLDTAVGQFFECFYRQFLLHRKEFSESASIARCVLRQNPRRYDYNKCVSLDVQDWFVPVVYSNGDQLQVRCAQQLHQTSIAWLRKPLPLRLTMRLRHYFWIALLILLMFAFPRIESVWLLSTVGRVSACLTGRSFCLCSVVCYGSYRSHLNAIAASEYVAAISDHEDDRKNLLRIESILKYEANNRKVFVHSTANLEIRARPLIRFAINTWKRTNFINDEDLVMADWFIQHDSLELLLADSNSYGETYIRLTQFLRNWLNLARFELRHRVRRMMTLKQRSRLVVVVDNFTVLGGSSNMLGPVTRSAQRRFQRWLLQHFASAILPAKQPYLIMIGKPTETVTRQWLRATYPEITSLWSVAETKCVPPSGALAHQDEAVPRQVL